MQDCEIISGCFTSLYSPPSTTTSGSSGSSNEDGEETTMVTSPSKKSAAAAVPSLPSIPPGAVLVDNLGEIKAAFDDLKEVVGLFIVPPPNLAGLMNEGFLSTQDRNELFLYISMRADFRTHGMISPWVRNIFTDVREDVGGGIEEEGTGSGRPSSVPRASSPSPGGGSPSRR